MPPDAHGHSVDGGVSGLGVAGVSVGVLGGQALGAGDVAGWLSNAAVAVLVGTPLEGAADDGVGVGGGGSGLLLVHAAIASSTAATYARERGRRATDTFTLR